MDKKPTDLATTAASRGIATLDDNALLAFEKLAKEGFREERTFWIGDPKANPPKVPVYFGQLIDRGGDLMLERMGGKQDPETGEVEMSAIPTYLFYPLDFATFKPISELVDTVLCNAQVATACGKYLALAKAEGGTAQILFRWNGKVQTRKGNQMNDVSIIHRIFGGKPAIDVKVSDAAPAAKT